MIDVSQSSEIRFPNPHLGERENHNIIQSEIEGGVYLRDLPIDGKLEIQTRNRAYMLTKEPDGNVLRSGHPEFCPSPTPITDSGSNWGGAMLKEGFVGRGMHLEFRHPDHKGPIITSQILEMKQAQQPNHP